MTATIRPPAGARELKVADPAVRLREYESAFAFYLTLIGGNLLDNIVFVENSQSDLQPLMARCAGHPRGEAVEFLSFNGLDYPPHFGRGYGEFRLLDHAMQNSKVLASLHPTDHVWKVTGRYIVSNLSSMIRTAPRDYEFYCDLKTRPRPWMDLRLFSFTPTCYKRLLLGIYPELSEADGRPAAEVAVRKVIAAHLDEKQIVPRFRREPKVEGVRGYDGRSYSSGRNRLKYVARAVSRRIIPGLWI